ncbi:uncharacterized protein A4U43_C08F17790 [Asparagus officinalis]|nr:uncharacterized protein A4U43_C08F17790 [Asparagus officinalis]
MESCIPIWILGVDFNKFILKGVWDDSNFVNQCILIHKAWMQPYDASLVKSFSMEATPILQNAYLDVILPICEVDLKITVDGFNAYPSPSLAKSMPRQFLADEPLKQSLFPLKKHDEEPLMTNSEKVRVRRRVREFYKSKVKKREATPLLRSISGLYRGEEEEEEDRGGENVWDGYYL